MWWNPAGKIIELGCNLLKHTDYKSRMHVPMQPFCLLKNKMFMSNIVTFQAAMIISCLCLVNLAAHWVKSPFIKLFQALCPAFSVAYHWNFSKLVVLPLPWQKRLIKSVLMLPWETASRLGDFVLSRWCSYCHDNTWHPTMHLWTRSNWMQLM